MRKGQEERERDREKERERERESKKERERVIHIEHEIKLRKVDQRVQFRFGEMKKQRLK